MNIMNTGKRFLLIALMASMALPVVFADLKQPILSLAEEEGILLIREEEKLARDVYLQLAEFWSVPIFTNIARSEQTHMDAMGGLIETYALVDPIKTDARGQFSNPELAMLYQQLIEQGSRSPGDAVKVGAMVEELDIYDIRELLAVTDNEDVRIVYQNLSKGSRNHLRSFYAQITKYQVEYTPVYLTDSEFEEIISSPAERGGKR